MPILKRYTDKNGFYVHGAYSRSGLRHHSTYQITTSGVNILWQNGVRDDDEIPRELFFQLLDSGDLYTGGGDSEEIVDRVIPTSDDSTLRTFSFEGLSQSCRGLIVMLLVSHPTFKFTGGSKELRPGESVEFKGEGMPPWFVEMLYKVAHMPHGEEFLNDLCAAAVNREVSLRNRIEQ